jgi:aminopeptidase N
MWFFDKWFMAPGHPELKLNVNRFGDSLEIMIRQTQDSIYSPVFEFPLTLGLYGERSSTIKTWIDSREHKFKIKCADTNVVVVLNPDGIVPSESEFRLSIKDVNRLVKAGLPFYTRLRFAKELTNYSEEVRVVSSIPKEQRNDNGTRFLIAFDEYQSDVRSALLRLSADSSVEIRSLAYQGLLTFQEDSVVEKKAIDGFLNDKSTKVRAEAIKYLSGIDSSGSKYRELYSIGIKDSSYLVISSCLEPYLRIDPEEAGTFIKTLESSKNIKIVKGLMTFYTERKDSLKRDWAWDK